MATLTLYSTMHTPGPLSRFFVGQDLSFQVEHRADSDGRFRPRSSRPADLGIWVLFNSTLYGPDLEYHPSSDAHSRLGVLSSYSFYSQSPELAAETGVYQIATTVEMGNPLYPFHVTAVLTYIRDRDSWRTDIHFDNLTGSDRSIKAYYAGAPSPDSSSDNAYGEVDEVWGAPIAKAALTSTSDLIAFYPASPGSHYYHDVDTSFWDSLLTTPTFPDSVESSLIQGAMGLGWSFTVPKNGRVTKSVVTRIRVTPVAPPTYPDPYRFRGFVYQGVPSDTSSPLGGITLRLYDGPSISPGYLVATTVSDASGFWFFYREDTLGEFWIQAQDPIPWTATGASTPSGSVIDERTLYWSGRGPGIYSDNLFWMIQA